LVTQLVWTFRRIEKFLYLLVIELLFLGRPVVLQTLYQLSYSGSPLLQNSGESFLVKEMMVKPVSKLINMRDNIAVNYREKQREICDRMHSIISEFVWKCFVTTVTDFIVL